MEKDYSKEELALFIGKKIQYYRKKKKWTQTDLGEKLGTTKSTISGWETGARTPQQDSLFALAKILDISIDDLFPPIYDEETNDINIIYNQLSDYNQCLVYDYASDLLDSQIDEEQAIYLVGQTAAGAGVTYGDAQYDEIKAHVPAGADYALTVKGDSMEPLIKDGSIIFCREQPVLENGQIGIIELNEEEVTCKKFYKEGDKVVLKSINPKYDDMVLDKGVRILGKVIL